MQLLVSVTCADEAVAAREGGAHVIDAKDPASGALGAVGVTIFSAIRAAVHDDQVVSAALGDARDGDEIERLTREFAWRGASLVKIGFAGIADDRRVRDLLVRAARGCRSIDAASGVVAVAYADADREDSIDRRSLVRIAARAGARGVLVDTADKHGPGLTALWRIGELTHWVAHAHAHGLFAAVAGRLTVDDLDVVGEAGADIAGVRGAACVGGRLGRVSAERVRALRDRVDGRGDGAAATAAVSASRE